MLKLWGQIHHNSTMMITKTLAQSSLNYMLNQRRSKWLDIRETTHFLLWQHRNLNQKTMIALSWKDHKYFELVGQIMVKRLKHLTRLTKHCHHKHLQKLLTNLLLFKMSMLPKGLNSLWVKVKAKLLYDENQLIGMKWARVIRSFAWVLTTFP